MEKKKCLNCFWFASKCYVNYKPEIIKDKTDVCLKHKFLEEIIMEIMENNGVKKWKIKK